MRIKEGGGKHGCQTSESTRRLVRIYKSRGKNELSRTQTRFHGRLAQTRSDSDRLVETRIDSKSEASLRVDVILEKKGPKHIGIHCFT